MPNPIRFKYSGGAAYIVRRLIALLGNSISIAHGAITKKTATRGWTADRYTLFWF